MTFYSIHAANLKNYFEKSTVHFLNKEMNTTASHLKYHASPTIS